MGAVNTRCEMGRVFQTGLVCKSLRLSWFHQRGHERLTEERPGRDKPIFRDLGTSLKGRPPFSSYVNL